MTSEDLQQRTKKFSLDVIQLFKSLPGTTEAQVLGKQLLRCATSVAANYRAARRARSKAEFIAKLCIVVEESDEAVLWLELLGESGIYQVDKSLLQEAVRSCTSCLLHVKPLKNSVQVNALLNTPNLKSLNNLPGWWNW